MLIFWKQTHDKNVGQCGKISVLLKELLFTNGSIQENTAKYNYCHSKKLLAKLIGENVLCQRKQWRGILNCRCFETSNQLTHPEQYNDQW